MKAIIKGIDTHYDLIVDAMYKDLKRGKYETTMAELAGVKNEIFDTIKNLKSWAKDQFIDQPLLIGPGKSSVKFEPLGVVCVYSAWNYPFALCLQPVVGVIAAGNCAMIKPSELAPNVSFCLEKFITSCLDQRFYRCIQGKGKVAVTLNIQRFDMFVFTGSTAKGKMVAKSAAVNLVPCILELGGKSPVVIDSTADVTWAAKKLLFAKVGNFG